MDEKKLLDNWSASGKDVESFKEAVKEMSESTYVSLVRAGSLKLYSKAGSDASGNLNVYVLDPNDIWEVSASGDLSLKRGKFNREAFEKANAAELVKEYENSTKLLIKTEDNKTLFTSLNLCPTFGLRTQMGGDATLTPSIGRDIHFAERLKENEMEEISLIVRRAGGIRKAFAALSGTYTYEPQTLMSDTLNRVEAGGVLGKMECHHWTLNNQIGEIFVEFPEKAAEISAIYDLEDELVPGLYIAKSDVGECSITIRATWRIGSSIIILDELKRKHSGKIDVEKILEDVDKIVFSKYTKLPERLCELMSVNITDPKWKTTLSTSKFESANKKAVCAAIKSVLKQIGLVDATTKKIEKQLYEALCDEIDPSISFTAYDIAMMIMQLPERRIVGLSKAYIDPLAKACGKAPYVKYDKVASPVIVLAS